MADDTRTMVGIDLPQSEQDNRLRNKGIKIRRLEEDNALKYESI